MVEGMWELGEASPSVKLTTIRKEKKKNMNSFKIRYSLIIAVTAFYWGNHKVKNSNDKHNSTQVPGHHVLFEIQITPIASH